MSNRKSAAQALHEIEQELANRIRQWRRDIEDPAMTEGQLRQQLRYMATTVEHLATALSQQQRALQINRGGFWLMTVWAVVLSFLVLSGQLGGEP